MIELRPSYREKYPISMLIGFLSYRWYTIGGPGISSDFVALVFVTPPG